MIAQPMRYRCWGSRRRCRSGGGGGDFPDLNDYVGSWTPRQTMRVAESPDDKYETNGLIISDGNWCLIATFGIRVVPVVFLGVVRSKMPFDMVSVVAVVVVFVWVQVGVWHSDLAIKRSYYR
jgi:hypothetical protein